MNPCLRMWMLRAVWALADEIEPGAQLNGINITVTSADGQILAYAMVAGSAQVLRGVITDPDLMVETFETAAVDTTVPDGLDDD